MPDLDPTAIAQAFHEAYERLAPSYGYETRRESAVPWADVPEQNRALMTAVAAEVAPLIAAKPIRERDSLARRLSIRFGELEEARAALRQAHDEQENDVDRARDRTLADLAIHYVNCSDSEAETGEPYDALVHAVRVTERLRAAEGSGPGSSPATRTEAGGLADLARRHVEATEEFLRITVMDGERATIGRLATAMGDAARAVREALPCSHCDGVQACAHCGSRV